METARQKEMAEGATQKRVMPESGAEAAGGSDTGLSDLAYDWITILKKKAEALRAYNIYLEDARKAHSQECIDLLQRIRDADRRQIDEIKQHVQDVLIGKMSQKAPGSGAKASPPGASH